MTDMRMMLYRAWSILALIAVFSGSVDDACAEQVAIELGDTLVVRFSGVPSAITYSNIVVATNGCITVPPYDSVVTVDGLTPAEAGKEIYRVMTRHWIKSFTVAVEIQKKSGIRRTMQSSVSVSRGTPAACAPAAPRDPIR